MVYVNDFATAAFGSVAFWPTIISILESLSTGCNASISLNSVYSISPRISNSSTSLTPSSKPLTFVLAVLDSMNADTGLYWLGASTGPVLGAPSHWLKLLIFGL